MSWLLILPAPPQAPGGLPVRRLRPRSVPPAGAGPYTERHDGPAQERMEPEQLRDVFDKYEDGAEKVGYPYVDRLNANARCPYDGHEMVILQAPDRQDRLLSCPFCRRQLAVSDPKEQRAIQVQPNPERESVSTPDLPMEPRGTNPSYDPRDYPSQTGPDLGA